MNKLEMMSRKELAQRMGIAKSIVDNCFIRKLVPATMYRHISPSEQILIRKHRVGGPVQYEYDYNALACWFSNYLQTMGRSDNELCSVQAMVPKNVRNNIDAARKEARYKTRSRYVAWYLERQFGGKNTSENEEHLTPDGIPVGSECESKKKEVPLADYGIAPGASHVPTGGVVEKENNSVMEYRDE
jgi:hypothetical protein